MKPFKFARIKITKVQIEEITIHHLTLLLEYKFHSISKFRNMPHKLLM